MAAHSVWYWVVGWADTLECARAGEKVDWTGHCEVAGRVETRAGWWVAWVVQRGDSSDTLVLRWADWWAVSALLWARLWATERESQWVEVMELLKV